MHLDWLSVSLSFSETHISSSSSLFSSFAINLWTADLYVVGRLVNKEVH